MKRHGDDGGYGNMGKRQRADGYAEALAAGKFEMRMLIQSKAAGGVIGKAGENIKRLRAQYDAVLSVPDSNSPERHINIVSEIPQVVECIREIIPKLDESRSNEEQEVRLLVHQSHAGAIIGRGGFKIKELRDQTGTTLKVFSQCCPMSTDRVLQINGSLEKLVDCIRAVIDLLHDIPIKGPSKPYDTINYDPSYVQDYGGYPPDRGFRGGGGGGGGGMGPHGGGGRMGGGPPPMGYGPPMPRGPPRGPPGGHHGGHGGPYGGYHPGPGAGGGMGRPGPPPQYPPYGGGAPLQTTQVTIPSELGGTIIGKGGERINRIREDSGAHIIVDPAANSDERIITISGTQNQIQTAQYLLQQCVRSSIAGRKYLNDQH